MHVCMYVHNYCECVLNVCTYYLRMYLFLYVCIFVCMHIQSVSRILGITAGGDFLGLCDQKCSYKHVSDFGRLRSYDRLNLGREGNDY